MSDPVLQVVAGPNRAGKSTFYVEVLGAITGLPFISADAVASERWPDSPGAHAYDAARLAAAERSSFNRQRTSFITETVFSHESKIALMRNAEQVGYRTTLHVILIPEELAVARVRVRVEHGGHDVPEEKIRRRFERLWGHLQIAIDIAHETHIYDNTRADAPFLLIATYRKGRLTSEPNWPAWTPTELRASAS